MIVTRTVDEPSWRAFLADNDSANVFHTPEMFHVFERATKHKPQLWAAVNGDRVMAMMMPIEITLMGGALRRLTTRSVVYGGVLQAPGVVGREALDLMLRQYRSSLGGSVLFTEIRHMSDASDATSVLDGNDFIPEQYLNILIDLSAPPLKIMERIGRRTRRHIRRAMKNRRIRVVELLERSQVRGWYKVLRETYERIGVPLVNRSFFEVAFDELVPAGMLKFFGVTVDNRLAACSAELLYKRRIYGWYGGSAREFSRYSPNELLVWHVLEWGANHGYQVYDFGGAGKPGEDYGVRNFKDKFGGNYVCYGRSKCIHSRLALGISEMAYKAYRLVLRSRTRFDLPPVLASDRCNRGTACGAAAESSFDG